MNTSPVRAARVRPVPTKPLASSSFPAPRERLNPAAMPTPTIWDRAMDRDTRGKTTLVAALPSMPTTWPMKTWSVML